MKFNFEYRFTLLAGLLLLPFAYQNCGPTLSEGDTNSNSESSSASKSASACAEQLNHVPATLLGTCLSEVFAKSTTAESNIFEFEPQYPLYTEGADKRRWIYLPPATSIDTSNPDQWIFPVGSILWKEFSIGGRKIETRMMQKVKSGVGKDAWQPFVYLWRKNQTDADLTSDGQAALATETYEVTELSGRYTVPSPKQCMSCHAGKQDVALGFSYLQLSLGEAAQKLSLSKLNQRHLLKPAIATEDTIEGDLQTKAALGFLHANCAHCHNPDGLASGTFNVMHASTSTSAGDENAYKNLVSNSSLIVIGHPEASPLLNRIKGLSMPPQSAIRSFTYDVAGVAKLTAWISSLNQTPYQIQPIPVPPDTPIVSLVNVASGKCVDVTDVNKGQPVVQSTCNNAQSSQKFFMILNEANTYTFKNTASSKCLMVEPISTNFGYGNFYQAECDARSFAGKFYRTQFGTDQYSFATAATSQCLDLDKPELQAHQNACDGSNSQRFLIQIQ